MGLPTICYDRTAGKTKAAVEWVFILWQLWGQTAWRSLFSSLGLQCSTYWKTVNNGNITFTAILPLWW